jgi:hypothetical protein
MHWKSGRGISVTGGVVWYSICGEWSSRRLTLYREGLNKGIKGPECVRSILIGRRIWKSQIEITIRC